MTKRILANRIKTQKESILVVEQLFDDIGLGIMPTRKSIVNFDSSFNSETDVKNFIEANDWIFQSQSGEEELCELILLSK